mgnify:CR=1 FL=1|tara:strand:- start:728 stop:1066 length:339 start_codon:yes stop_codon:yes gene_type:complete
MKLLISYLFLLIAIMSGIIANGFFLKLSSGFTKFIPSLIGSFIIILAYFSLSRAMENIPIGFTYATYGSLTTIGALMIGMIKFNQIPNTYSIIGVIFILIGVVLVNYFGNIS